MFDIILMILRSNVHLFPNVYILYDKPLTGMEETEKPISLLRDSEHGFCTTYNSCNLFVNCLIDHVIFFYPDRLYTFK